MSWHTEWKAMECSLAVAWPGQCRTSKAGETALTRGVTVPGQSLLLRRGMKGKRWRKVMFTCSLNIPGAKRCLFIFEVSSIYYQSAASAQEKVTFYIYSYINMYIIAYGAGTIFIHSSVLYFKILKTCVQKSLPPIPYSHGLPNVSYLKSQIFVQGNAISSSLPLCN